MKLGKYAEQGSVLLITFITITIMTLLCATTLYVSSQNANTTAQTTSWQQALSGTETLITQAIDALNATQDSTNPSYASRWVGWKAVTQSVTAPTPVTLPTTLPTGGTTIATNASGPANNQYYYYVSSGSTLQGENANTVGGWVTIDTGGGSPLQQTVSGTAFQWYRIRATGTVAPPAGQGWLARVGNSKLDNDLRKISLIFDRKTGQGGQKVYRIAEVIAQPVLNIPGGAGAGWTMKGSIKFSGVEMLDSFNSRVYNGGVASGKSAAQIYASQVNYGHSSYSVAGYSPVPYANRNVQIGTLDSTGGNFNYALIFGSVVYSGPTLKGTGPDSHGYGGVQGTVSTPFNGSIPAVNDPSGSSTNLSSPTGNLVSSASGTKLYKFNGDFTLNSGQTLNITASPGATNPTVALWVTGNINLNGKSNIVVQDGVTFQLYGDKDINFVGSSFQNNNTFSASRAVSATMTIFGTATAGKMTISSNPAGDSDRGTFVGQINAPGYYVNVKSDFDFYGSVIGSSSQTSAGAKYHFDEALGSSSSNTPTTVSNYAYASWFEDSR